MNNMRQVGVALIFNKTKNKVLIGRRAPTEPYSGFWEFPGGKLEKGETPEEAIQRELMEELNVKSHIKTKFDELTCTYPTGKFKLLIYFTEIDDSTLTLRVHDKLEWVKINEAFNYNLFSSNVKILNKLKKQFEN